MYELLLVLVVILFLMLRYRETFVVKYGNPFNDEDILSFEPNAKGKRLFGITPDTCPANKSELDAGLCYEACEDGYHGVGPVCWADTFNVGIGKVIIMRSCEASGHVGWGDAGLFCVEPISCASGLEFFTKGCSGGRSAWKQFTCDDYGDRENVDGLCYKKCPEGMQHVPSMPYLCYKGKRGLSYGRGVGDVPPLFAFGE